VSNFDLRRWREAERSLGGPVLTNQVQYSMAVRGPEQALIPWAQANDRIVIAYSPLAQGFLSARYSADNRPGGVRAANSLFLPENLASAEPLFEMLRRVAKEHDATPAQVALAWVIRRPNVVAIPGASSLSQLEANAAASDLDLTDAEDAELTAAADRFRPVQGVAALPRLARARLRR
jgi:aryl-alcohol dehydrogenase-like predicted oxidoreductase